MSIYTIGVYNLTGIVDHFDSRGLSRDIFYQIFKCRDGSRSSNQTQSLSFNSQKNACGTNKIDVQKRLSEFSLAVLLDYLSIGNSDSDICRFPRIRLLHGTADKSIPYYETLQFGTALTEFGNVTSIQTNSFRANGDGTGESDNDNNSNNDMETRSVDVTVKLLQGKTHLDPFVIDPLRGGRDTCVEEIVEMVLGEDAALQYSLKKNKPLQAPHIVSFGGQFSPF